MKPLTKPLPISFFDRSTTKVARDLVGCYLVKKNNGKIERYLITETEAYDGPHDLACHGAKGLTQRTKVLFGKPGYFYIYLIYGMYWLLNVVTGPEGYPAGVLIRGLKDVYGPGRITRDLIIGKNFHGKKAERKTGLWFEKRDMKVKIKTGKRIGVNYAGPIWSKKLWRFTIINN